jgi:multiple sugar transport system substrate-binding protein
MKALVASILLGLAAWSVAALLLLPDPHPGGRHRLVWTSDDNPARQEQIRLFHEQYPDCLLQLDPTNAAIEKVIVQSSAGQGPDLFDIYGPAQLAAYVKAGVALDITELARERDLTPDRLWPQFRSGCVLDGRQYGFLTNGGNRLVIYNRNLFARFGVPERREPIKWDEFVALAIRLTRSDDPSGVVWGLANYHWQAAIWQNGGRVFSDDGTKCTVDSPEAVEAVQWYVDLIRKHRVMPSQADIQSAATRGGWAGTGHRGLFLAGKAAMMVDGRWMAIVMRRMNDERRARRAKGIDAPSPIRYGFAPTPYRKVRATAVGVRCTAINSGCKNPEQAIKFLTFLTSEPYCQHINDSSDGMSAVERYATSERLKNPDYSEEYPFAEIQAEEMKYGRTDEVSPFIEPAYAAKIIEDHVRVAEDGHMPVKEAMERAAATINQRILRNVSKFTELEDLYRNRTASDG